MFYDAMEFASTAGRRNESGGARCAEANEVGKVFGDGGASATGGGRVAQKSVPYAQEKTRGGGAV